MSHRPDRRHAVATLMALGLPTARAEMNPRTDTPAAETLTALALAYENQEALPALPAGQFRNPVLPGFFPDPSICRVGDDYILASSTFTTFPGIALHHSRDLVNWRLIGHAVTRPGSLRYGGLHISRGLFAPAISHHRGRWYLVCTMVGGGGNFVVTAERPEGPWSEPVWLGFEGIDPSLFFDDDGQAWMLNNGAPEGPPQYPGHRAIWLQAFDTQTLQMTGPRRVLVNGGVDFSRKPVWIEGPHLVKRNGWYILSAAEGGTSLEHSQVLLRSRKVSGPYEPWAGNPTLTQRDLSHRAPGAVACTGHADFVEGPGGQWWAVFLGCRPLPSDQPEGHWLLGRETFLLPVQWTPDGWPQILPAGQRVPLQLPAPAGAAPQAVNSGWQIDFTQQAPRFEDGWITLRAAPLPPQTRAGLQMPAGDPLDRLSAPSALLRRVQHQRFSLRARLRVPAAAGVQGALLLFQSERQHDLLGVTTRAGAAPLLRLQRCDGGRLQTLFELALPADARELQLRVQADERVLRYEAAVDGGAWQTVAEGLSHRPLSVQAAGDGNHFTGLLAGLLAQRAPAS